MKKTCCLENSGENPYFSKIIYGLCAKMSLHITLMQGLIFFLDSQV